MSIPRRSSVYARHSLVGGLAGSKLDINKFWNIRDKQFQLKAQTRIAEFLEHHNFSSLGPKTLTSPTKKEFELIFKFIYEFIDPGYMYVKKFEEEVPSILRQTLKYPFAETISKSALYAVGSVQSWAYILAMLYWMTELAQVADQIEAAAAEQRMVPSNEQGKSSYELMLMSAKMRAHGAMDQDVAHAIEALYGTQ
jgi:SMC interacting uncharacterized protein involved in chromosome segregation